MIIQKRIIVGENTGDKPKKITRLTKKSKFAISASIKDRSLILPGIGVEDICDWGTKFYPLKGMEDEKYRIS